jgi:uncharacterized repeat protein (TIGR01451 family)
MLCASLAGPWPVAAATLPGTQITNRAEIVYVGASGAAETAFSNVVELISVGPSTRSVLTLTRIAPSVGRYTATVGPTACLVQGASQPLADPTLIGGRVVDPTAAQTLIDARSFHGGEPIFVRVEDRDQDLDATARDFVNVTLRVAATGDSVAVRMIETDVDSGVFVGYVPSAPGTAADDDCVLQTALGATVEASYVDAYDASDRASAEAPLDPVSRVFDALTGEPVDGARVTLVDAATGAPAAPLGDDGTSAFPATIESGATVADASGGSYAFGRGEFRFPVIPAGQYRLSIEAPTGYAAPSQRSVPDLQSLPGAPFELVAGSFGAAFVVDANPVAVVDVPVDPSAGQLFLDKHTATTTAAVGDFIEYRLTLTHPNGLATAEAVTIEDRLPVGLKYQSGSAHLGDAAAPIAPILSADGRTLSFAIGDVAPGGSVTLSYVAAVVPGVPAGDVVNVARAAGRDIASNEARARVTIVDDLYTDAAFLAGRVLEGSCEQTQFAEDSGVAGVSVYLEDGRFAVSDEGGRFHFEGLAPGSHVLQLDVASLPPSLELVPCAADPRFAGTSFSRFVSLAPGALGRADFYVRVKPPPSGHVSLDLHQTVSSDLFRYRLEVGTDDAIGLDDARARVLLPPGLEYVASSASGTDPKPITVRSSDDTLTFDLGSHSGPWHETLVFTARATMLEADAEPGERPSSEPLTTRAVVTFSFEGTPRQTPVAETRALALPGVAVERSYVLRLNFATLSAELGADDRVELDALAREWRDVRNIRIEALGHSDSMPIRPSSRHLYKDNYELSSARAEAVARYLRMALAVGEDRVTYRGFGPDRPVADNATAEGRTANRRVELSIRGVADEREARVALQDGSSGPQTVAVTGQAAPKPTMNVAPPVPEPALPSVAAPDFDLGTLGPTFAWLWPLPDASPSLPSVKVAIGHSAAERVRLTLNGRPVSELNFEGTKTDAARGVALSLWRGIDLADGPNHFVAIVTDASGAQRRYERDVHFAGTPVRGTLVESGSALVADGHTRPVLAVRLVDRWGRPARPGSVGQFDVGAPYRSWADVERLRDNPVVLGPARAPQYRVGADGLALIELEPTTHTGEVVLTLHYPNQEDQRIRAWLAPAKRDFILVGFAEGTLGYNTLRGNLESAAADGIDADYFDAGRLAFFAKGRVKGSLLTLAFDTAGRERRRNEPIGGVIDPDRYYTLYGDNTEQRFDAPSRERLYVKIEQDAFMAMFGDYDTGLTVTELGRYNRSFTGFKSERHGERLAYTAFAADSDQAFVKDELRGNGTSGPYGLSRTGIVAGSDHVTIEVRDRFEADRVLESRALGRHFDYDIDYTTGTLYFKSPVATRDFAFNPEYIVVDYESRDGRASGLIGGGRAAVTIGTAAEVGMTLIRDGTQGATGTLAATDFRYRFGPATELTAELAASTRDAATGEERGGAYRLNVEHRSGGRELTAFLKATDETFGLGQQTTMDKGTRVAGARLKNELNTHWRLEAQALRQEQIDAGAVRTVLEGETRYQDARRSANSGLRRVDERLPAQANDVTQAFAGGSWRFLGDLLTARASFETDVGGAGASADYPERSLIGFDVAVAPSVTLFGEHELATNSRLDAETTRVGVKLTPGEGTQVETALNETATEYGPRTYATLGLAQAFTVGSRWTLDLGGERSSTVHSSDLVPLDPSAPLASGELTGDYASGFVGTGYRAANWTATTRLEYRTSDTDTRRGLIGGFYRERTSGHGFSAEVRLLDRADATGLGSFDGLVRLGWAYRPAGSRWIVFERADWRSSTTASAGTDSSSRRLVSNLSANFRANARNELGLQLGAKRVTQASSAFSTDGFLDLLGIEWRRALNERLDVGVHASRYRAHELDVTQHGSGIDFGIGIAANSVLTVGYNFAGFEDGDFSAAGFTAAGPFLSFRLKIDQASLKDLLRR